MLSNFRSPCRNAAGVRASARTSGDGSSIRPRTIVRARVVACASNDRHPSMMSCATGAPYAAAMRPVVGVSKVSRRATPHQGTAVGTGRACSAAMPAITASSCVVVMFPAGSSSALISRISSAYPSPSRAAPTAGVCAASPRSMLASANAASRHRRSSVARMIQSRSIDIRLRTNETPSLRTNRVSVAPEKPV